MTLTVDASRTWVGPTAPQRLELLRRSRSIAIVGASENPARASYFVATYLLSSSPYEVYFVNPRATEILGRPVYATLADLPVVPDVVDVFRRHDDLPEVLEEVLQLRRSRGDDGAPTAGAAPAVPSMPSMPSMPSGPAGPSAPAGPSVLWLQLGSWHEDVARRAQAAGLDVVMDRCVKIEHARFHGGLHLAGFDTGVISSRRQLRASRA